MDQISNAPTQLRYRSSSISAMTYSHSSAINLKTACHCLIFLLQGEAMVLHGDAVETASAGQILFLKRDVNVDLKVVGDGNLEVVVCEVAEDLLEEYARNAVLPDGNTPADAISVHAIHQSLHHFFIALIHYFTVINSIEPWVVRLKILELMYCIGAHNPILLRQLLQWKQQVHVDIMAVVHDNIDNALSLTELARLSGRSLSSFKRDFYAINNMAPSRWIRNRKLEKARELLANTSLSVSDVCYTLGFENVTHFSRIFKAHFRVSPSGFKRTKVEMKVA